MRNIRIQEIIGSIAKILLDNSLSVELPGQHKTDSERGDVWTRINYVRAVSKERNGQTELLLRMQLFSQKENDYYSLEKLAVTIMGLFDNAVYVYDVTGVSLIGIATFSDWEVIKQPITNDGMAMIIIDVNLMLS